MREIMKKFRNFQDEVFGSGALCICEVKTHRLGIDDSYVFDIVVFFTDNGDMFSHEWRSWEGEESDWEEFKNRVRERIEK